MALLIPRKYMKVWRLDDDGVGHWVGTEAMGQFVHRGGQPMDEDCAVGFLDNDPVSATERAARVSTATWGASCGFCVTHRKWVLYT